MIDVIVDLKEDHGRLYLNGDRVRDTDTFTYFLKGEGWQEGFKTVGEALLDMEKQDQTKVNRFIMISMNERAKRGERVR